jgi:DNA-binding ferritin-like protein
MIKLKKIIKADKSLKEVTDISPTIPYNQFIVDILCVRDYSHIFHWQTDSFAEHKAFGKFYEEYVDLVDELVEMLISIHGVPNVEGKVINLTNYTVEALNEFFTKAYTIFNDDIKIITNNEEILDHSRLVSAKLNTLKYLLTLK